MPQALGIVQFRAYLIKLNFFSGVLRKQTMTKTQIDTLNQPKMLIRVEKTTTPMLIKSNFQNWSEHKFNEIANKLWLCNFFSSPHKFHIHWHRNDELHYCLRWVLQCRKNNKFISLDIVEKKNQRFYQHAIKKSS